ncbi:hypothetical protein GCM10010528_07500 [Gordonia defluvii]|jgi:sugar lactone lactonase YvrE|uniref:SMP-30/Gluconolactonase/LRE-like region domain-containing protein n=1 Tax=Gordonia defluvii TaxID=283718 RepID=A0ABP6L576_9ACTN|nr:hypothetical protein [Gordonia sp. UBA5067]
MRSTTAALVLAAIVVTVSATLSTPPAATAAPPCGSPSVTVLSTAKVPVFAWSENLGYDQGGRLWVSRLNQGEVERLSAQGRRTAVVTVESPGAVRLGPDGLMYVASGTTTMNMLPGAVRTGRVLRFDSTAAHPVPHTFARGLGMPNGMAFGADRALYVADGALGVLRIRPNGSVDRAWSAQTASAIAPLTNGLIVDGITADGNDLYVTFIASRTGRVLRIPIHHPAAASTLDLTGPRPGFLDDLATLPQHRLAVATATGQLITVDTKTGRTCSYDLGQPLTAAAVDPVDSARLTIGTESGDLLSLRLPAH